jgi:hypothetical protein
MEALMASTVTAFSDDEKRRAEEERKRGKVDARPVPPEIERKYKSWRRGSARWSWFNSLMGITAALLSTLIAANAKGKFLQDSTVLILAMIAAALAFLVISFNADLKAKGFALAAREIEIAIARYRFDEGLKPIYLADAEVRGIGILNMFDSKKSS